MASSPSSSDNNTNKFHNKNKETKKVLSLTLLGCWCCSFEVHSHTSNNNSNASSIQQSSGYTLSVGSTWPSTHKSGLVNHNTRRIDQIWQKASKRSISTTGLHVRYCIPKTEVDTWRESIATPPSTTKAPTDSDCGFWWCDQWQNHRVTIDNMRLKRTESQNRTLIAIQTRRVVHQSGELSSIGFKLRRDLDSLESHTVIWRNQSPPTSQAFLGQIVQTPQEPKDDCMWEIHPGNDQF